MGLFVNSGYYIQHAYTNNITDTAYKDACISINMYILHKEHVNRVPMYIFVINLLDEQRKV